MGKTVQKTFRFMGGEIVNEFLVSIGYLPGAHPPSCSIHMAILETDPMWAKQ